tara:strand:+ start:87 stop:242 length:156 start_codon:yes stop_codon:yes gene_type:complete
MKALQIITFVWVLLTFVSSVLAGGGLGFSDWFGLMLITVVLPWGIYFIVNK